MRYRNVIEYAASKGLHFSTRTEAKLALLEEATDNQPLYARGNDFALRPVSRLHSELWDDWAKRFAKHEHGVLKKFMRRVRVLKEFEARAVEKSRLFGLLDLDEYRHWSLNIERLLEVSMQDKITATYPDRARAPKVTVRTRHRDPGAAYERMHATFYMTREALLESPCGPIVQGFVVLDARHAYDGVWYMTWAGFAGRVKKFVVSSGGYYEGELVLGFDSFNKVFANYDAIQRLARTRAVSRALKG